MSSVVSSQDPISDALGEALNCAQRRGRAVFLRLFQSFPYDDVWPRVAIAADQPCWAWADRDGAQVFFALGMAAQWELNDEIRFAKAARLCEAFQEQVMGFSLRSSSVQSLPEALPLAMAGFAFAPGRQCVDAGPWQGWNDGSIWVPELLLSDCQGVKRAVLTVVVEPQSHMGSLEKKTRQGLKRLEHLMATYRDAHKTSATRGRQPLSATDVGHVEPQQFSLWCQRVEAARQQILEGQLAKVVLARAECLQAPHGQCFDALASAWALRERYAECKIFLFQRADGSAWVGASPELLLERQQTQVNTVALAGTTGRGQTDSEDQQLAALLEQSPKEQHEHFLVQQAIRQALAPVAERLDMPDAPHVYRLPNVQHLRTPIEADIPRWRHLMELAARLHPTPAVAGVPRQAALGWIKDNEHFDRGWYAGLVGWMSAAGDGVLAVALRSALLRGDKAWAFAGAGLVAESEPEAEWHEVQLKLRAMRHNLLLQTAGAN